MPVFEWTPAFDVGVTPMNLEHKKLIGLMNLLYEQFEAGVPRAVTGKLLDELVEYTVFHFESEERFMEKIQFPELDRHKLIHADLLERVADFKEKFDGGEVELSNDFFNFLKLWLAAHMRGIDRNYGPKAKK